MGFFKDVINTLEKEKQLKEMENKLVPDGISFLDKNLSRVILSVTGDGLLSVTVLERTDKNYESYEIVLDKDHIYFLGKAMSEYLKNGNLDKLQKEVGKF